MNEIKVSFFKSQFKSKPTDAEAAALNKIIAKNPITVSYDKIKYLAKLVGECGCTFCPATFTDGLKSKANFEQTQLLALDFDNKFQDKTVSFEQVKKRADYYDLRILFAYDTFGSNKITKKFRVVFLNDVSIPNIKVAETVLYALHTVFPEADPQGKSAVQMYYGGIGLFYFDDTIPEINIESVFRNLTICFEDQYGVTNIRRHTEKFSRETGLAITKKGKFDVSMVYDISDISHIENVAEENIGASSDDNNSPKPFIVFIIKGDGEKLSKIYYVLNYGERSTRSLYVTQRKPGNHKDYRSIDLARLRLRCQLFREFETGERKIPRLELFGIATNLINAVESGSSKFMEILRATSRYDHHPKKYHKWKQDLRYMKDYKPSSCNNFCPYKDKCSHGTNMLARPKRNNVEKMQGYEEAFDTLEDVAEDVYQSIYNAYRSTDVMWYIIKAMTSSGKTTAYLRLIKENNNAVFLISALTNILKDEIYERAVAMGLNVMKTPSLEEIKDKIPDDVWRKIMWYYKNGLPFSVHLYIHDILQERNIPCLREYMYERERLKTFNGSVITTHRYLLNMSAKRLGKYDSVIVDEDIIKSVISNQCTIPLSGLKKLSKEARGSNLSKRIKKLLQLSVTTSCIELDSIKCYVEDDEIDIVLDEASTPFDTSAFFMAHKFYIRRASKEWNINEDTLVFIKPVAFKEVKHIMVSATVDEDICRNFFGENKVNFYECKKAKYKGNLYQYPHKSMSRDSINNTPGIIQRLTKHFGIKDEYVITHKGYGKGPYWIGNTEGSNYMEGENILVAATPYHAEFLYKLIAHTMGLTFDKNAEMKEKLCTHNGHRFWIKTYEDDTLRNIHFWMIESELEQAVGRARLLWHECTVHLCSRFPLSQTQISELILDKEASE